MRFLWVFFCALIAAPALAAQNEWPALFDVIDVSPDDTLNVRAGPGTSHPVIGTLGHDETGIEVLRPNDAATWGQVNLGERTGWVSLAYLSRQPGQWVNGMPRVAACFGTEPFWSLRRTGEGMDLATPDGPGATVFPIETETRSQNRTDRFAIVGTGRGDAPALYLSIARGACSDGMSDREFGFVADMLTAGTEGYLLRSGCCTLAGR